MIITNNKINKYENTDLKTQYVNKGERSASFYHYWRETLPNYTDGVCEN